MIVTKCRKCGEPWSEGHKCSAGAKSAKKVLEGYEGELERIATKVQRKHVVSLEGQTHCPACGKRLKPMTNAERQKRHRERHASS